MTRIRPQFHVASEVFDDLPADRQAQAGALRAIGLVAALAEFFEDQGPLCRRNTRAIVMDLHRGGLAVGQQFHADAPARLRHELAGVGQEVQQDLRQLTPRDGEILWLQGSTEPWAWLRRPHWLGDIQGAGIVFSRDMAMLYRERA